MYPFRRLWLVELVLMLVVSSSSAAQELLAIRSTTIVDVLDEALVEGTTLLIREGRIEAIGPDGEVAIPSNALVVDGSGTWATPGLIDVHTHTSNPDQLRSALALGVTTILTVYSREPAPDLATVSEDSGYASPRVHLVAGRISAGFPAGFVGNNLRRAPQSVSDAQTTVAELADMGFQHLKIWQDDGELWRPGAGAPLLSPVVIAAITDAAHRRGMRVYLHAWQREIYREGLDAGVDWIIHPFIDAPLDIATQAQLKEQNAGWTSTLTALLAFGDRREYATRMLSDDRLARTLVPAVREGLRADAERESFPDIEAAFPAMVTNFQRYLVSAGDNARVALQNAVPLALGSDDVAGYGTHIEMELLSEQGLMPMEILRAATVGAARALGLEAEVGTLAVGKRADVLLVYSDPTVDVRNLRDVFRIVKAGRLWRPDELLER